MRMTCSLHRFLCGTLLLTAPLAATTCDGLAGLKLAGATITAAQNVAPGAFTAPGAPADDPALATYRRLQVGSRAPGKVRPGFPGYPLLVGTQTSGPFACILVFSSLRNSLL